MSRQRDIHTAIAEIIKHCTKSEFESLQTYEYFAHRHAQIAEEFASDIVRIENSGTRWSAFLREINFWNTAGVELMSRRLLRLALQYMPKGQQFFNFSDEIGAFTIPTRTDRLNKISLLARELLFDIFPRIESHLNFETGAEVEPTETVHGTINWDRTILDSVRRGQKFPLQFSCIVERTHFETPENSLALYSILRLQYDLESILFFKDDSNVDLNFKEIRMLKNLKSQVDNIVLRTKLRGLIPKIEQYRSHGLSSRFVQKRENRTRERIRRGDIRQKSYSDLIEWIRKYRGYNVRSLSKRFTNFPADHTESFDTMYELWIIFEIMAYLQKNGMQLITILENDKKKFAGFKIRSNDVIFRLNYQGRYDGWTEYESNPDFTVQIEGTNSIPIIMDPKNWAKAQAGEAIHKMLGYLLNLSKLDASIGILFFSHATSKLTKKSSSRADESHKIHGREFTLSELHVNPTKPKHVEEGLEAVYEHILAVCRKINNMTNE